MRQIGASPVEILVTLFIIQSRLVLEFLIARRGLPNITVTVGKLKGAHPNC